MACWAASDSALLADEILGSRDSPAASRAVRGIGIIMEDDIVTDGQLVLKHCKLGLSLPFVVLR